MWKKRPAGFSNQEHLAAPVHKVRNNVGVDFLRKAEPHDGQDYKEGFGLASEFLRQGQPGLGFFN